MDPLDYWRLCDELSVVQAALLIVEEDPSENQIYVDDNSPQNRPAGYDAVVTALGNAILAKRLPARIGYTGEDESQYSWHATTIGVEDLKAWLKFKGIATGFFFPTDRPGPDYLSDAHPNYSPKLAAAIEAWRAVSADPELRSGRSVKQALNAWLRQHANKFGLTKEDGNPNEQGIEEVAKIANWDTRGGAPKTPGGYAKPRLMAATIGALVMVAALVGGLKLAGDASGSDVGRGVTISVNALMQQIEVRSLPEQQMADAF